jgi:hypothetical protein
MIMEFWSMVARDPERWRSPEGGRGLRMAPGQVIAARGYRRRVPQAASARADARFSAATSAPGTVPPDRTSPSTARAKWDNSGHPPW